MLKIQTLLRFSLVFMAVLFLSGESSGQEERWKYRYTIADFDQDGYTDTLCEKSFQLTPYNWTVYAVDGRTGEKYCLFADPGKLCPSFLYYIPLPDQFRESPVFSDSLYAYTTPKAVKTDTFTPEIEWLFRMRETTRLDEQTRYGDRICANQGIKWINEAVRAPVHTITEVDFDSAFERLTVCNCGYTPPPLFSHRKGWLVYSAINHRHIEDWGNPGKTWKTADSGVDTKVMCSNHGVIVATDTSYAWLFHASAPLAPLGYLGIRGKSVRFLHREKDKIFISVHPGVTNGVRLYIVEIPTGKVCGMDVCKLVIGYESEWCFRDIVVRDGVMIFIDVGEEGEVDHNVEMPLEQVVNVISGTGN